MLQNKLLRKYLLCSLFTFLVIGCDKIDRIDYEPKIKSETFLNNQHHVKIEFLENSFILSQPSSSIIVYFVSLFSIWVGINFIRNYQKQQIKKWWGIGLFLTGIGALFAGTSYQAFGYEIKCNGNEFCSWTSWWEIWYLFLSSLGMNAFLIASAFANKNINQRKPIVYYAIFNVVTYSLLLFLGVFKANKFLVSFEFLIIASAPTVLYLLYTSSANYYRHKSLVDFYLRNAWLILISVGLAYTAYFILGFTTVLWQHKIWFSENDVLHVGMIYWVYYLNANLPNLLKDAE